MQGTNDKTSSASADHAAGAGQGWVGPDLPSLSGIIIGSVLFFTGGMLMFTVIGIPPGILLFAAGLGLMLEPKKRTPR
jgi:hypothetical protein